MLFAAGLKASKFRMRNVIDERCLRVPLFHFVCKRVREDGVIGNVLILK